MALYKDSSIGKEKIEIYEVYDIVSIDQSGCISLIMRKKYLKEW
jgi:hypothetical protein